MDLVDRRQFLGSGLAVLRLGPLSECGTLPPGTSRARVARIGFLSPGGPSVPDQQRRTAYYVDKILKGAQPGDLPIEQPTSFDFTVNITTARALGITIPPSVLAQATEIVQ